MNYSLTDMNSYWGYLIVEELFRQNVKFFCISPGSRSTPLTLAAAKHQRVQKQICLDERGAAFFALGYALARHSPAALICTSGTAAANYYPAVIEAAQSNVPLILLTADRPPELRDSGANQTIDQVKMFGKYVKWFFDFPCPDPAIDPAFVLSSVGLAVSKATSLPAGPVHLNFMFREPLTPQPAGTTRKTFTLPGQWKNKSAPLTRYNYVEREGSEKSLLQLALQVDGIQNGLILAGQGKTDDRCEQILRLSKHLNWPLFADVLSGIQRDSRSRQMINFYDHLLLNKTFAKLCKPKMVIQFGRPLTSKRVQEFLATDKSIIFIQTDEAAERMDPAHQVTERLICSTGQFIQVLLKRTKPKPYSMRIKQLKQLDKAAGKHVTLIAENNFSEISVAHLVAKLIPENNGLFLANSMPVRDADMYAVFRNRNITIRANRGASGIDGTIASAAGFAAGMQQPATLITGDLAALHDINSLRLIKDSSWPVIIIILNNDGGGIFSFLPIAEHKEVFEQYFATPHGLRFEFAARMFNLIYEAPDSLQEFSSVYLKCLKKGKSALLEIRSHRSKNERIHRKLQREISRIRI